MSLEIDELTESAAEASEMNQHQQDETSQSRLTGSCSADDHALDNCTFSSLQRCHVCNKFLWGLLRQGYHCHGGQLTFASFVDVDQGCINFLGQGPNLQMDGVLRAASQPADCSAKNTQIMTQYAVLWPKKIVHR